MADDTSASVITLHQPRPKKAKTPAERAAAYRARKKAASSDLSLPKFGNLPVPAVPPPYAGNALGSRFQPYRHVTSRAVTPIGRLDRPHDRCRRPRRRRGDAKRMVRPEPRRDRNAGWLFLAVGVAADLAALAVPSVAARAWQARQRGAALAGWAIWALTFCFAITNGFGFASVNISDVTMARGARVTPAVTAAQSALGEAMVSRDRQCGHGVGPFCRQREAAVVDRRQALDLATQAVEQTTDPQTAAAVKLVSWASLGAVRPTADDFGMLRLMLLSLLPQLGGLLLMVGRGK